MSSISKLHAREVLDSRGNPTIEVELSLSDGSLGRAIVPSGASKGEHEALELRDGDKKRFGGKGVLKAVETVNQNFAKLLKGKSFEDQAGLDRALLAEDGSPQKSKLGGNTILGVSLAFAHAVAASRKQPLLQLFNEWMGLKASQMSLPIPLMNVLNGGQHANNGLAIQEFMIVPHGFETFSTALRAGVEVFQKLKEALHDKHLSTAVGDEGGFAPTLASNEMALELICDAVGAAGYKLGDQIALALDVAASSFYDISSKKYQLTAQATVGRDEMIAFYASLLDRFPIVSIEDGLEENDWAGWHTLTQKQGGRVQLVGDDLFVTQAAHVQRGIDEKVANAILIKVNQVGTLTETFDTMRLGSANGYRSIVSHRSGETEDTTIAHLAVGSGCGQIKTGSASRSERMAKYNELLRIEEWAKLQGKPLAFSHAFSR